jgi:hypothetical protein
VLLDCSWPQSWNTHECQHIKWSRGAGSCALVSVDSSSIQNSMQWTWAISPSVWLIFTNLCHVITYDNLHRITAIHEACHDLVKNFHAKYSTPLDATRIRSVAVSGHQHGLVLLDENDDIVRPCMM